MRFLRRSSVVRNVLLFCFLSLFFLSVVNSLSSGVSALNIANLISFVKASKNTVLLGSFAILMTIKGVKWSPYLFLAFCIFVLSQSLTIFLKDFDKLILGLSFLYSIVAYNLFLFLRLELEEPFYNPHYPSNILPSFENRALPVTIKDGSRNHVAHLTNWGQNGFYCKLESSDEVPRGRVEVEINYEGFTFQSLGIVMTSDNNGLGVKINKNPVPELGWPDFYGIISELGLKPS